MQKSIIQLNRFVQSCLGPLLILTVWLLVGLHVYAYIKFIVPLLLKRLGTTFAMIWGSIGCGLLYNIIYNHTLCMLIKPGSPTEQRLIENIREKYK